MSDAVKNVVLFQVFFCQFPFHHKTEPPIIPKCHQETLTESDAFENVLILFQSNMNCPF